MFLNRIIPQQKIKRFCRRNHIKRLSIFGSFIHGNEKADSDLDVLVEFEEGHTPGLAFFEMEQELCDIIGKKVDLNTPQFLSRYFRKEVLREARVQYEHA